MSTQPDNAGAPGQSAGAQSPPPETTTPAATATKAAGRLPIKVGDLVQVHVLVGGPQIRTLDAEVLTVTKSRDTRFQGEILLDLEVQSKPGVLQRMSAVRPEPASGASLNIPNCPFPCWARTEA